MPKLSLALLIIGGLLLLAVMAIAARQQKEQPSEPYMNYPQLPVIDPTAPPPAAAKTDQKAAEANVNYRSVLKYLQENPANAFTFLADVKAKFFDDSCRLKEPRIDFAKLEAEYRPVF